MKYAENPIFLDGEELTNIIFEYLEDSIINNAILIDGDWGSGKTYYINKKLIPALEKRELSLKETEPTTYIPKNIIYVSLYGVSSLSDISNQIFINVVDKKIPKHIKKSSKYFTSNVTRLASDISGLHPLSETGYRFVKDRIGSVKNSVLIFDDLERCNIQINEVLGYINTFVEHDKIKTIIVANEPELGNYSLDNNIESKYLVALDSRIEWDNNKKKSKNMETLTIKELNARTQKLFKDNVQYKKIKEKLIGITIKFRADLDNTIDDLISEKRFSDDERKVIQSAKARLLKILNIKNHYNIRTIQTALSFHRLITESIKEDDIEMNIKEEILEYCLFSTIVKSQEGEKIEWDESKEYGPISLQKNPFGGDALMSFKFIDELVYHMTLDKNTIRDAIINYRDERKQENLVEDDSYKKLETWWENEDLEVTKDLEELILKLENDNYSLTLYQDILMKVASICSAGFDTKYLNDIKDIMIKNVSKKTDTIDFGYSSPFSTNEKSKELFNQHWGAIEDHIDEMENKNIQNHITQIFKKANWSEELNSYFHNNNKYFNSEFISRFDYTELIEKLSVATSKDIIQLRQMLNHFYGYANVEELYKKDLSALKDFFVQLKGVDTGDFDKIKTMHYNLLIEDTSTYIRNIDK